MSEATPIPMRLPCPECGALHIDEGEFATKTHHTHACQHCGHVWRPAIVATVGVRFLPGFKNEPAAVASPAEPATYAELGSAIKSQIVGSAMSRIAAAVARVDLPPMRDDSIADKVEAIVDSLLFTRKRLETAHHALADVFGWKAK